MDAQQIQELVVAAGAVACGVVLLAVEPSKYPEGIFKTFVGRLGRHRRTVGAVIVLIGLAVPFT